MFVPLCDTPNQQKHRFCKVDFTIFTFFAFFLIAIR